MAEYQDWVYTYENIYELEIINLVMDNPDCWDSQPGYYPHLLGCFQE